MSHYGEKPIEYITNLINYKGENSLFSFLKRKFLITNLDSGNYATTSFATQFGI